MGSEAAETAWQPSTDAQALAQLRGLIRAYIRGALSHSAFILQVGTSNLTHDLATPRPPEQPEEHKANCGCHWVRMNDPRCIPVPGDDCELGHCEGGRHDGVSCHLCNSDESPECVTNS